jgi:hypothetical protein
MTRIPLMSLLYGLLALILAGKPVFADMRDTYKKQQKAYDYQNSCSHYDKAQWQGYRDGLGVCCS